jgi:hypothetical protein
MTVAIRVIPCLDVDAGRVVKGVNFENLRDAGDPVELASRYDAEGADELTFLDVSASSPQVESKTSPSDQRTPVYRTVTTWPTSTWRPSPRISGCTTSPAGAAVSGGTVMLGAPSSASVTVGRASTGSTASPDARGGSTSSTSATGTPSSSSSRRRRAPTRWPRRRSRRSRPIVSSVSARQRGAAVYVFCRTVPSLTSCA